MTWPNLRCSTRRGIWRSLLHDRMMKKGVSFEVKSGWERPNGFARTGQTRKMTDSLGRQNWFENQAC